MDQTRQVIRTILQEADTVNANKRIYPAHLFDRLMQERDSSFSDEFETYTSMQPGFKGFLTYDGEWITWPASWPSGIPHHDDVQAEKMPYADIFAYATIMPLPDKPGSLSKDKFEVDVRGNFSSLWADDTYSVVNYVTSGLNNDMRIVVEAFNVEDMDEEDMFDGTIKEYFQEWRKN